MFSLPDAPALAARPRWPVAIATVALAAIALVTYLPSLDAELLNWDDDKYVMENPFIAEGIFAEDAEGNITGFSRRTFTWAFYNWDPGAGKDGALHASNWHPLTWISHAIDVELYGNGAEYPRGHHLTNIILHAINTALVMLLMVALTRRFWVSVIIAGVFALHPLHVESVSWVAERKDLLSALFMFATLLVYVRYASAPRVWRYVLMIVLFALALMAKPMAVSVPVVMVLLDVWPLKQRRLETTGQASWRTLIAEKVPLVAMTVAACLVTMWAQHAGGAMRSMRSLDFDDRIINALYAYMMYLVKFLWPWPGTLVPMYPTADYFGDVIEPTMTLVNIIVLGALTIVSVRQWRRRPYLAVGWAIYLITLLPVIGIVQVGKQVMADRYTYVPLLGPLLMMTLLVDELVTRRSQALKSGIVAAAVAVVAVFGVLTWHQQAVWADSVTFWSYVVEKYPKYASGHNNLGRAWNLAGNDDMAIKHYREAIELDRLRGSHNMRAITNLGNRLVTRERYEEADELYDYALRIRPDFAPALNGKGKVLMDTGSLEMGKQYLIRAIKSDPKYWPARTNLAVVYRMEGKVSEAIEQLRAVIREYPDKKYAYAGLADALRTRGGPGDIEEAARMKQEYLRLERLEATRARPAPNDE